MDGSLERLQAAGIFETFDPAAQPWVRAMYELPQPLVVSDASGDIILFNPSMEELTGISATAVESMEPWEVYRTQETHGTKQTVLDRTLETEKPLRGIETNLLDHEDNELTVVATSTPI